MRERRDLREQLGLDGLAGDEQLDRLEAGIRRCVDEVFSLGDEQPELVTPAPVMELADELEPLVVARGDQACWSCWSAALACSAIAPNAAGSLTARSASTFRSSSMPALPQP